MNGLTPEEEKITAEFFTKTRRALAFIHKYLDDKGGVTKLTDKVALAEALINHDREGAACLLVSQMADIAAMQVMLSLSSRGSEPSVN